VIAVARHLLESTIFACLILLLNTLLIRHAASVRHALLVAAVMKFAIPLTWMFSLGLSLRHFISIPVPAPSFEVLSFFSTAVQSIPPARSTILIEHAVFVVWLAVASVLLAVWLGALLRSVPIAATASSRDASVLHALSRELRIRRRVNLRVSTSAVDPYLVGLVRPTLILPEGLSARLSLSEFEAILLHELAHAKRWDNLIRSAVHVVVCLFWFYPLLRWLERRLEVEAEIACDELVLNLGVPPEHYRDAICKVCQQILLRPVTGRSYVSSSNLSRRLEHIMSFTRQQTTSWIVPAFGAVPLAIVLLATTTVGFALFPQQAQKSQVPVGPGKCVIADQQIPQGAVVRLNNGDHLLLCTTVMGLPRFAPTTEAARDRSKSIINVTNPVAPQSISCNETEPQGKLCTCDHLQYSPGAVVGSPRGGLVCPAHGGHWQIYKGKQNPWPPEPAVALR